MSSVWIKWVPAVTLQLYRFCWPGVGCELSHPVRNFCWFRLRPMWTGCIFSGQIVILQNELIFAWRGKKKSKLACHCKILPRHTFKQNPKCIQKYLFVSHLSERRSKPQGPRALPCVSFEHCHLLALVIKYIYMSQSLLGWSKTTLSIYLHVTFCTCTQRKTGMSSLWKSNSFWLQTRAKISAKVSANQ